MSYVGYSLKQWSMKLREYIADERPLNIDEMRNLADVISGVCASAGKIVNSMNERSVPTWLKNDWNALKYGM